MSETPVRPKLQLNKTTIRTLRKGDLQQVVGGSITLTVCSVYCCPTEWPQTCTPECSGGPKPA